MVYVEGTEVNDFEIDDNKVEISVISSSKLLIILLIPLFLGFWEQWRQRSREIFDE